jgi:hypothetical protein
MADDLDVATRCARTVALLHPTVIRRAPIGMYYLYEDPRIRLRVSDQIDLDDFGVWSPAHGDEWIEVLRWSPYMAESERPQIFLSGVWIPYLHALAACRSREWLNWRAAHWNPARHEGLWRTENDGARQTAGLRSAACNVNSIP